MVMLSPIQKSRAGFFFRNDESKYYVYRYQKCDSKDPVIPGNWNTEILSN